MHGLLEDSTTSVRCRLSQAAPKLLLSDVWVCPGLKLERTLHPIAAVETLATCGGLRIRRMPGVLTSALLNSGQFSTRGNGAVPREQSRALEGSSRTTKYELPAPFFCSCAAQHLLQQLAYHRGRWHCCLHVLANRQCKHTLLVPQKIK